MLGKKQDRPAIYRSACCFFIAPVALWIGYGVFRGDWVIIMSNSISLLLLLGILFLKLQEKSGKSPSAAVPDRTTAWRGG